MSESEDDAHRKWGPPTEVTVTLSLRDWIVLGTIFTGIIAWGVRLEMRIANIEEHHLALERQTEKQFDKLENKVERIARTP